MLWWAVVKVENVVFLVFVVSKGTVFSGPAPHCNMIGLQDLDLSILGGAQRYSEHRILTAANEGQMDIRLEATRVGLESTGKYLSNLLTLKSL